MEAALEKKSDLMEKYSVYKDSSVEWLGEIPEHWEIKPGMVILKERSEKNIGLIEKQVLSLSYGKVVVKPEEKLTGLVPESFETYQIVNRGDIIIRPTDLQNDKTSLRTGLAKDRGIITSAYINLQVLKDYSSLYYHYLLHIIDVNKVIYGLGSGLRQNLSFLDFRRFPFPVPPISEQTAIASFLDHKTEQIDKAIAIKEKQIELLKERRQILIHRAVTRGLDPDVKMKDSGVEWIGKVPEHWEVKRLKYLSRIFRGKFTHRPRNDERLYDGEYPFFQTGDVAKAGKHLTYYTQTLNEKGLRVSSLFPAGTVVITIAANIGDIAMLGIDACFPDSIVGFEPKNDMQKEFLYHTLSVMKEQFISTTTKNTQMNLNVERIGSNHQPCPPIYEQTAICRYIDKLSEKISLATNNYGIEITKVKEYKTSLINAAVTGKVKVPGV